MEPGTNVSASAWKLLVVCPPAGTARELQEVLAGLALPAVIQAAYPQPGTIAHLASTNGCNLCVLEVSANPELALRLMTEMASLSPVVALHPRDDAALILKCVRSGAREFLSEISAPAVAAILERVGRPSGLPQERKRGSVYCVVPGKAGCGASTVAVHLAMQLRQNGKAPVLLADLDPLTGSIAFMLKLHPEFHLEDVLRDWSRMDRDLWSRLTVASGGVDVLPGRQRAAFRSDIDRGVAGQLLQFWRELYQAVVIDPGDLRSAMEAGFVELADEVLLVTAQDVSTLHATRRSMELLAQVSRGSGKVKLVLNRYSRGGPIRREDLRTALQAEPFATIGDGLETLQSAVLRGDPTAAAADFRGGVLALARQLEGAPAKKKSPGWLGFLSRRS